MFPDSLSGLLIQIISHEVAWADGGVTILLEFLIGSFNQIGYPKHFLETLRF